MGFRVGFVAVSLCCLLCVAAVSLSGADKPKKKKRTGDKAKQVDAKNVQTGKPPRPRDPEFEPDGIYAKTAPRAEAAEPIVTELPLRLKYWLATIIMPAPPRHSNFVTSYPVNYSSIISTSECGTNCNATVCLRCNVFRLGSAFQQVAFHRRPTMRSLIRHPFGKRLDWRCAIT